MQRFYFHLHNGADVSDDGGKQFPDLEAARVYAKEMARFEIAEAVMRDGRIVLSHRIDVGDESGAVLATVHFGDAIEVTP